MHIIICVPHFNICQNLMSRPRKVGLGTCITLPYLNSKGKIMGGGGGKPAPHETPTTVCFIETPTPPLKLNLNGNYPYYPNYLRFLERPYPHSHMVLFYCSVYNMGIDSHYINCFQLVLAFLTLTDLCYPPYPPSEGYTVQS